MIGKIGGWDPTTLSGFCWAHSSAQRLDSVSSLVNITYLHPQNTMGKNKEKLFEEIKFGVQYGETNQKLEALYTWVYWEREAWYCTVSASYIIVNHFNMIGCQYPYFPLQSWLKIFASSHWFRLIRNIKNVYICTKI